MKHFVPLLLILPSCAAVTALTGGSSKSKFEKVPVVEANADAIVLALQKPGLNMTTTGLDYNWIKGRSMEDGAEAAVASLDNPYDANDPIRKFTVWVTPSTGSWSKYWSGDSETFKKEQKASLVLFAVGEETKLDDGFDIYYSHYRTQNKYETEKQIDYYSERNIGGTDYRCGASNLTLVEMKIVREMCRSLTQANLPPN